MQALIHNQKSVLIICQNEICYNARLLKAADYFYSQGYLITVFNPLTGIASEEVYKTCINKRNWKIFEADISKRTAKSWMNWLFVSIINKIIRFLWNRFRISWNHAFYFNKGLLLFPRKLGRPFNVILIHLVDSLPFAVQLKRKTGAKLIYDSQEYFIGQFATAPAPEKEWVLKFEKKYIGEIDILLATTRVMLERIKTDYSLSIPSLRVRNLPAKRQEIIYGKSISKPLRLIWHGMGIFLNNRRGVHVLIRAVARCSSEVQLFLQGRIDKNQLIALNLLVSEYSVNEKVFIIPPAHPDLIVESLTSYDIGLLGEIPVEDNQRLTSSNKLFDYIYAGLAVIAPDIPGLNETLDEYQVGLKYEPGNERELAEKIDLLAGNPSLLEQFRKNSQTAARNELFWENDYLAVLKVLNPELRISPSVLH